MRLDYLELCGFRGFRERQRVDFGPGFTVICGRNGVGKSTLCDAVEFALTGQIDKYLVDKAARESLDDYVWWRGEGQPEAHFVTVGFRADDGSGFAVTRSRETGADRDAARIEALLCVPGAKPERALQQVCRTSIIRDEWIAALSLDLTETQRFELVRAALGAIEGPDYAAKAREVMSSAEGAHNTAAHAYEEARARLTAALTDLEETRDVALQAGDIAAALSSLDGLTPAGGQDLGSRVAAARQALARRRLSLGEMGGVADEVRAVTALRDTVAGPDFRAGRDAAAVAAAEAEAAVREARQALEAAEARLHREQETDALAASLAILVDHGSRVGLHDDRCPLCRAPQGASEFETGLAAARERLAARRSGVPEARAEVAAARTRNEAAAETLREAEAAVLRFAAAETELSAREEALSAELARRSLDGKLAHDAGALDEAVQAERSRLIDLERSILTLEASQAVERVTDLEAHLEALRVEADAAADRLARARAAVTAARTLDRTVRRTNAEIIDERLAVISPLLNELYQRLRPHSEWRTIDYGIRGDVKRFLSLRVGNGLNPQFVFSSGQRRAAGLAFLLSVHLSRPWCTWRTLMLDDPVQHIDDFRALHLVEVLSALQRSGRQIVCAVEDPSLAELLCRRLISEPTSPGRRHDLDLVSGGGASITRSTDIAPAMAGVLGRTRDLSAAG